MTARYDVYRGDIIAHIDGRWRQCRLIDGWCTIARWAEPNQHLGVAMVKDLESELFKLSDISWHPAVFIGPEVTDRQTQIRLPYVRYGRVASVGPFSGPAIIDAAYVTPEMQLSFDYDEVILAQLEAEFNANLTSPSSPQT